MKSILTILLLIISINSLAQSKATASASATIVKAIGFTNDGNIVKILKPDNYTYSIHLDNDEIPELKPISLNHKKMKVDCTKCHQNKGNKTDCHRQIDTNSNTGFYIIYDFE